MKQKSEAIVIGNFPFGESHKVIVLFTPTLGIIKAVAHGIRKPNSKFGSSMELLNTVEVVLYISKKTDLHTIKEYTVISHRHLLHENKEATGEIFYFCEFLNEFFKSSPPNQNGYFLINDYLDNMSYNYSFLLFKSLVIKILYLSGFIGNFGICNECGKKTNILYLSYFEGFLFCDKCKKTQKDKKLSPGIISVLDKLLTGEINEIIRIKLSDLQKNELDLIINSVIKIILGHALKSESLVYLNQ